MIYNNDEYDDLANSIYYCYYCKCRCSVVPHLIHGPTLYSIPLTYLICLL